MSWDDAGSWQRRRRQRVAAAVIAVLVTVALIGSLVPVIGLGSDDEDVDGLDPEEVIEEALPEPGPPASEEEIRQAVDDIIPIVEAERGLEFQEEVTVELVADDEFERRLLEEFEDDAEDLRDDEVLLTAFGLVDPQVDLVDAVQDLLGAGVVGFYDPETEELVVRGTELTPLARITIAHELVHALDDQHFGLDRPEHDDADDEVGFGFTALVEGNARRIDTAFAATLTEGERQAALAEQLAGVGDADLASVPMILVEMLDAPYSRGSTFVEELLVEGGQDLLDAAFEDPPRTSQQVLDPDAFIEGNEPIEVPAPAPGGEVVDEGMIGQLLIELILAEELGLGQAAEVAAGWGGDQGVTWRDGERSCGAIALVGETAGDTEALAAAFEEWADAHPDATVTVEDPSDPVTVEACT